jgi:hypothetical protein
VQRIWPAFVLVAACSSPGNSPLASGKGLALIAGGPASSAIVSLVDAASSKLARDVCLESSTAVAPWPELSDDLAFATAPQPDHQLLVIDRGLAVLDWFSPSTCHLVTALDVGTGFASSPEDVAVVSKTKAYVTRAAVNPTPGAQPFDGGNDLLIIDPSSGQLSGRVDLSGQATSAAVQAQPDRALFVRDKVYVSLANRSADGKTVARGRVVVVDPATDAVVATIDLPAFKGCSGLDYLPASKDLVVGCGGDPNDTLENQTAQSAIVLVNIGGAAPSIMTTIGGAAAGNRPLSAASFASVGDDFVLAVSPGDGATPDSLWRLQLDSGTATHVVDGSAAGVFGSVVWDAGTRRAYLTDADPAAPVVRVFDVSNPRDTPQTATFLTGLAPRALAFY